MRWAPWVFLAVFFGLSGFARGAYLAAGQLPSAPFELTTGFGAVLLLWHWFSRQLAPYRPAWPPDMGLFIVAVWFLAMPYYLWRYERWRGALKFLALCGLWACSYAATVLVFLAFAPPE